MRPLGPGWIARCPAHRDRSPSLSLRAGDDGRVLVNCFAGCDISLIARSLDVRVADFFADDPSSLSLRDHRISPRVLALDHAITTYQRRVAPRGDNYALADELRESERAIAEARRVATDDARGWELLALAAEVERDVMTRDRWA